jgi:hypothetical protein
MKPASNKSAKGGTAGGRRASNGARDATGMPDLETTPQHEMTLAEAHTMSADTFIVLATLKASTDVRTTDGRVDGDPEPDAAMRFSLVFTGAPDGSAANAAVVPTVGPDGTRRPGWSYEIVRRRKGEPDRTIGMPCDRRMVPTMAATMHLAERIEHAASEAVLDLMERCDAADAASQPRPKGRKSEDVARFKRILGMVAAVAEVDPECRPQGTAVLAVATMETVPGEGPIHPNPTKAHPQGRTRAGYIDLIDGGFLSEAARAAAMASKRADPPPPMGFDPDTTDMLLRAMPDGWSIRTEQRLRVGPIHEAAPLIVLRRFGDPVDDAVETLRILDELGLASVPRVVAIVGTPPAEDAA